MTVLLQSAGEAVYFPRICARSFDASRSRGPRGAVLPDSLEIHRKDHRHDDDNVEVHFLTGASLRIISAAAA